jgi:hypothetical protein
LKLDPLVAVALLVVGHHVQAPRVGDFAEALNRRLALGAGDLRLDNGLAGLIGEEWLLASVRRHSGGCSRSILPAQRLSSWADERRPRAACGAEEGSHCAAEARALETGE